MRKKSKVDDLYRSTILHLFMPLPQ